MEDVIKPAKALFKALREAKTREEAAAMLGQDIVEHLDV